jgi:hypothetical protein
LRALDLSWDQELLVKACIQDTGFENAKSCAKKGWKNLMKAELKPKLFLEEVVEEIDEDGDADHQQIQEE